MIYLKAKICKALINYFDDDERRIEHALHVLKKAEQIAENKYGWDYDILIAVSLLHDIGIKKSESLLGYNNGRTQEEYGPTEAKKILQEIDFPVTKIQKVCEIIGNHHSPSNHDYIELKILKAADASVNKAENQKTDP